MLIDVHPEFTRNSYSWVWISSVVCYGVQSLYHWAVPSAKKTGDTLVRWCFFLEIFGFFCRFRQRTLGHVRFQNCWLVVWNQLSTIIHQHSLKHGFYDFPSIGNNNPIWLPYFSEGQVYHQPELGEVMLGPYDWTVATYVARHFPFDNESCHGEERWFSTWNWRAASGHVGLPEGSRF